MARILLMLAVLGTAGCVVAEPAPPPPPPAATVYVVPNQPPPPQEPVQPGWGPKASGR